MPKSYYRENQQHHNPEQQQNNTTKPTYIWKVIGGEDDDEEVPHSSRPATRKPFTSINHSHTSSPGGPEMHRLWDYFEVCQGNTRPQSNTESFCSHWGDSPVLLFSCFIFLNLPAPPEGFLHTDCHSSWHRAHTRHTCSCPALVADGSNLNRHGKFFCRRKLGVGIRRGAHHPKATLK